VSNPYCGRRKSSMSACRGLSRPKPAQDWARASIFPVDEGAWIRVPPRWRDVGVKSRHRGPRRNGWHNAKRYLRLGPSTLRVGMGINADQRDLSFGRRPRMFDIDDGRSQRLPTLPICKVSGASSSANEESPE
jgi:hypothetical protein